MSQERPLVFLASPSYGQVESDLTIAVLQHGRNSDLVFSSRKSSLLANNFNTLWCQALNNQQLGFDYFCMLHADISPQINNWLDVLIQEIRETGVDVLSVVAPLKDGRGLTSCGWLNKEGRVKRFTMKEIFELPETFTSESLGETERTLVMNTGLWICKWGADQEWREKVHFEIRDNIIKTDDGKFKALTLPEDWHFSQQCANLGVKIALTRKVPIKHIGRGEFENTSVWGTCSTDQGDPAE